MTKRKTDISFYFEYQSQKNMLVEVNLRGYNIYHRQDTYTLAVLVLVFCRNHCLSFGNMDPMIFLAMIC